jgi:hypothetical protein
MSSSFRSSRFVDFNTGCVVHQPLQYMRQFHPPKSLDDKIEIFECRVEVWQLGVAVEILKQIESQAQSSIWCHSAFALLSIIVSYFEIIGKSLNPNSAKSGTSGADFNWGFCDVYPAYRPANGVYEDNLAALSGKKGGPKNPDIASVVGFRNRLRNGMYHIGFIKNGLTIHNCVATYPDDFVLVNNHGPLLYAVNPHNVTRTIVNHFPTFVVRLRDNDVSHDALRKKFVEFYDNFHSV